MAELTKQLIELLLVRTKNRQLEWLHGSTKDSYKLELNSASFVITYLPEDSEGPDFIKVLMLNNTGAPIQLIGLFSKDEGYDVLAELYDVAKDSCTKETETIEKSINELLAMDELKI